MILLFVTAAISAHRSEHPESDASSTVAGSAASVPEPSDAAIDGGLFTSTMMPITAAISRAASARKTTIGHPR